MKAVEEATRRNPRSLLWSPDSVLEPLDTGLTKIAKLPSVNSVASVDGPRMSRRFLGSLRTFGTSGALSTNLSLGFSGMETSKRSIDN